MAADLTERASQAWRAWNLIRSQVTIVTPNATKAEDMVVKLDTDAVMASMQLVGATDAAWHWQHVLMLHDVAVHDARNVVGVCFAHGVADDVEADSECGDCRDSLGLEA